MRAFKGGKDGWFLFDGDGGGRHSTPRSFTTSILIKMRTRFVLNVCSFYITLEGQGLFVLLLFSLFFYHLAPFTVVEEGEE